MEMPLNDDEKLLVRKACDKRELADKRYTPVGTGFLNEREQEILLSVFENADFPKGTLHGGYNEADKQMMIFVPEYCELDPCEHIAALRCTYYKDYELSHRDFLGALMGLGIERETVGDIIVDKENYSADIVVKREILPFLLSDFESAGRAHLKVSEIPLSALEEHKARTVVSNDTVASPRLDSIVSSGFGISRENAQALIKSGKVYLNRRSTDAPDKTVSDASTVNAQGYGKFKVYITGNVSKKGRIFIKIEKFV